MAYANPFHCLINGIEIARSTCGKRISVNHPLCQDCPRVFPSTGGLKLCGWCGGKFRPNSGKHKWHGCSESKVVQKRIQKKRIRKWQTENPDKVRKYYESKKVKKDEYSGVYIDIRKPCKQCGCLTANYYGVCDGCRRSRHGEMHDHCMGQPLPSGF